MYSSIIIVKYILALTFLCSFTYGEICEANNNSFDCPREYEPYDFTECCMRENTTETYCCENLLHKRSTRLLMMISVAVISTCIFLSILIIICCFWSKCPLFDLCWVNYSQRGVIAYTKEEEALNEPPDENDYSRQYTPINMKVNQVHDL